MRPSSSEMASLSRYSRNSSPSSAPRQRLAQQAFRNVAVEFGEEAVGDGERGIERHGAGNVPPAEEFRRAWKTAGATAGKRSRAVVPMPGALSSASVAPCASASARAR